jgi:hypothetical protein
LKPLCQIGWRAEVAGIGVRDGALREFLLISSPLEIGKEISDDTRSGIKKGNFMRRAASLRGAPRGGFVGRLLGGRFFPRSFGVSEGKHDKNKRVASFLSI